MGLFNPSEFSVQLCQGWKAIPELKGLPTPNPRFLTQVLEAAYLASLETEEGRPLKFGLILRSSAEVDDPSHVVARFGEGRALTINEIRRLAPATSPSTTFIAVEERNSVATIWGTVDAGSTWEMFQSAENFSGTGLPLNLVINVRGPGTMNLKFADSTLFSIQSGKAAQPSFNVLKFGPVHEFFQGPLHDLLKEAFPERADFRDDKHFVISYGGEYLRFLIRLLRHAEDFGHGGTVIVVRESDVSQLKNLVSIKYPVSGMENWTELVHFVASICDEIEARKLVGDEGQIDRKSFNEWSTANKQVNELNQRLVDQSRLIARLTQVDGAVVLTDRLRVVGFGGIIGDLRMAPTTVRSCHDEIGRRFTETPSEAYGTRHRSSFSLCQTVECVVFVVSQDGGVKAIKASQGSVLLWTNTLLGPQSWFITAEDIIPELAERHFTRPISDN